MQANHNPPIFYAENTYSSYSNICFEYTFLNFLNQFFSGINIVLANYIDLIRCFCTRLRYFDSLYTNIITTKVEINKMSLLNSIYMIVCNFRGKSVVRKKIQYCGKVLYSKLSKIESFFFPFHQY